MIFHQEQLCKSFYWWINLLNGLKLILKWTRLYWNGVYPPRGSKSFLEMIQEFYLFDVSSLHLIFILISFNIIYSYKTFMAGRWLPTIIAISHAIYCDTWSLSKNRKKQNDQLMTMYKKERTSIIKIWSVKTWHSSLLIPLI